MILVDLGTPLPEKGAAEIMLHAPVAYAIPRKAREGLHKFQLGSFRVKHYEHHVRPGGYPVFPFDMEQEKMRG